MPIRPPKFRPITTAHAPRNPRPSAAARGYDGAWRRLRDQHLAASPVCVICESRGRTAAAILVDHITPIVVDPARRLDPTNLRSLCTCCHNEVTGRFRAEGVNEPRRSYA